MTKVSPQQELMRRRYLDAMGITSHVSRRQLPGAAPTHRLAITMRGANQPAAGPDLESPREPSPRAAPGMLATAVQDPDKPTSEASVEERVGAAVELSAAADREGLRFTLTVIFAGGVAWIEDLWDRPLASEQLQLVQAMARALGHAEGRPEALQFDWPPHNNQQFDLGPEAAQAALAGFLGRQLEQRGCRGMVLLGQGHLEHIPQDVLSARTLVRTLSTAAMLERASLKRQVWSDLQALARRA